MSDQLIEISRKDWPKLSALYESEGSRGYIGYFTVNNYIRWFEQDPNVKYVNFYCLNGDFSDGAFVVTDRYQAYADTLSDSKETLLRLLGLLDYSKGYLFLSTRTEVRPTILKAFELANLELSFDEETLLYHLPKEEALKLEAHPPDGIVLHNLNLDSDVEKVNSVYPFARTGSLNFFKRMAMYNVNAGAYKEDGTLVSWILLHQTGLLLALQTDKNHLGHGYAALVAKHVSKKIAESGFDIHAGVFEVNHPSRSLFQKLGYKTIGKVHWITCNHNWSDDDE